MSTIEIADAAGNKMTLVKIGDRLYPAFPLDNLTNLPNLKLRDDDVMLCAYPKSGTHWVYEICRLLYAGTTDIRTTSKMDLMAEATSQYQMDTYPSPRMINTHVRFDRLPKEVTEKKLKIINIRRNPKDVAVSYYNHILNTERFYHYNGEFKDYFPLFVNGEAGYGSWFDYVLEWEKIIETRTDLPILELVYEDLIENPVVQFRKISDFLDLERNEALFEEMEDFCSFSTMKERFISDQKNREFIFRKGKVGNWRNWFTVAQNEWFDRIYQEKMAGSKLKVKFTLD